MSDYKAAAKSSRADKLKSVCGYESGGSVASGLWDGFKAGAKDFANDARKMVARDTSGTSFDNRKALFDKKDKQ